MPALTEQTFPTGTIAGYPRIGAHREVKKLLEGYWKGTIPRPDFERDAAELLATPGLELERRRMFSASPW